MNAKILIVEDDDLTSMLYKDILESQGHYVAGCASTGIEAIAMAGSLKPDLILMDININGKWDGINTVKEMQKYYAIPVIYITADSDDYTKKMALETMPADFINKPISLDGFIKSINKALEGRNK